MSCVDADTYDFPTHDPKDSAFLRWLERYGLLERLETYKAPSRPIVIPELGWKLIRPTIYVCRVPPSGNITGTCTRQPNTHAHFETMKGRTTTLKRFETLADDRKGNNASRSSRSRVESSQTGRDSPMQGAVRATPNLAAPKLQTIHSLGLPCSPNQTPEEGSSREESSAVSSMNRELPAN